MVGRLLGPSVVRYTIHIYGQFDIRFTPVNKYTPGNSAHSFFDTVDDD